MNSFIISKDLVAAVMRKASDNQCMNDDFKLVAAFLALNAGVIALAFAGYIKGSINIGAVLQHLAQ